MVSYPSGKTKTATLSKSSVAEEKLNGFRPLP
jgi:hypothetical protein